MCFLDLSLSVRWPFLCAKNLFDAAIHSFWMCQVLTWPGFQPTTCFDQKYIRIKKKLTLFNLWRLALPDDVPVEAREKSIYPPIRWNQTHCVSHQATPVGHLTKCGTLSTPEIFFKGFSYLRRCRWTLVVAIRLVPLPDVELVHHLHRRQVPILLDVQHAG